MRRQILGACLGVLLGCAGIAWGGGRGGGMRALTEDEMGRIRGLSDQYKAERQYPINCAYFNTGANQVTSEGCAAAMPPPPNLKCIFCSDQIATFENPNPGGTGKKQQLDGQFTCTGQKSEAPCTSGPTGAGVCGQYSPIPMEFCTGTIDDWDLQPH